MIRPAILYKNEIVASMQEWYYTDSMLYYTGSIDNCIPEIAMYKMERFKQRWEMAEELKDILGDSKS